MIAVGCLRTLKHSSNHGFRVVEQLIDFGDVFPHVIEFTRAMGDFMNVRRQGVNLVEIAVSMSEVR